MSAPAVVARTVAVYQASGKGRMYHTKTAAYRHEAIQRINAACMLEHPGANIWHDVHETCRYCSRKCDGSKKRRHNGPSSDDYGCEENVEHSYRYRLVARLGRWLRWNDERMAK